MAVTLVGGGVSDGFAVEHKTKEGVYVGEIVKV